MNQQAPLDKRSVEIADQIVPDYRGGQRSYSCTGTMAKRWGAANDAARLALVEPFRQRLANRRQHKMIAVEHDHLPFKVGIGRERDPETGELRAVAEVFINAQKVNSYIDALVSDAAILMSMLLQYGCPAEDIARSMKRTPSGEASSVLGVAAGLICETAGEKVND